MIPIGPNMLAQEEGGGWTSLIYILVVIVLPMLTRLGAKIRERFGRGEQETETPIPEAPSRLKRQPAMSDRVSPAPDSELVSTPKPASKPPIPQARPSRLRPQIAPPPPARPIESKQRPRRAQVKQATARPLQARIAAMLTNTRDDPSGWLEPQPKQRTPRKAHSAPPPAEVSATKLILPDVITPGDLRAAVILSEILRPPLALREPNES